MSTTLKGQRHRGLIASTTLRSVVLILIGAIGLVFKGHYSGPHREIVHSYGGNVTASFAVYYLSSLVVSLSPVPRRFRKLSTAGLALAVVELFEAFNGFGVMMNTYDNLDFAANAAGVAVALVVDAVTSGIGRSSSDPGAQAS